MNTHNNNASNQNTHHQNTHNQNTHNNDYNESGAYAVLPYQETEIPLPAYQKQYLGLIGTLSSSIGYPLSSINYLSLITFTGETTDIEIPQTDYQLMQNTLDAIPLNPTENIWVWVSLDAIDGLDAWQIFKSDLPISLMQTLYEKAYHFEALYQLLSLIENFKVPSIKAFTKSLLHNEALMKSWFTLPASKRHHHAFPGGLIVHSLEVAQMVKDNMHYLSQDVSIAEQEVTILAALLHDIGKTQTLGLERHTDLGQLIDHEKLTLLVLAEPLSQLSQKWQKGSETLQYLLSWTSKEGFCKFIGGEIIKNSDQISTKLSLRRMAFQGKPDHFYYAGLTLGGGSRQFLNRL